jgi:AcrR family transcriptional regulator
MPKVKPEVLEARREAILRAALACFARKGYHQTTIDDIAAESGLSKGGVYWHFKSKREIFLESLASALGSPEELFAPALTAEASATEKLHRVLAAFESAFRERVQQGALRLMIEARTHSLHDPEASNLMKRVFEEYRRPLERIIEEGIAAGEFKPVDPSALACLVLAVFDGLMMQWMADGSDTERRRILEALLETLVAGLRTH